eukprot:SAG11_NODE_15103_length_589_cov_0.773469_1_plen_177_part_10
MLISSFCGRWVDYNHAPATAKGVGDGGGYMHMLFVYLTSGPILEADSEAGGGWQGLHTNRLVRDGFPSDLTDAVLTFRLRGELEKNGCPEAQLYFQVRHHFRFPSPRQPRCRLKLGSAAGVGAGGRARERMDSHRPAARGGGRVGRGDGPLHAGRGGLDADGRAPRPRRAAAAVPAH